MPMKVVYSQSYTDAHSIQTSIVDEDPEEKTQTSIQLKILANVHLQWMMELPPHTGCFIEGVVAKYSPNDGDFIFTPSISCVHVTIHCHNCLRMLLILCGH